MSLIDSLRQHTGNLLIGGHQGHISSSARQNTIRNFEQIHAVGLSHIEVDLQLTKDHEIVLYHDVDLSAQSPLRGQVRDYTANQLKDAFEIDTLEDVLCWCVSHNLPPALEIKCDLLTMSEGMPVLAERLAEILNRHSLGGFGFVFSANYQTLYQVKRLAPETVLGLIVPFVPRNPLRLMEEMQADIYLCYIDNLNSELVAALHRGGYYVDGSVINSEKRLQLAMELKIDLIETDDPVKMIELYRRHQKS